MYGSHFNKKYSSEMQQFVWFFMNVTKKFHSLYTFDLSINVDEVCRLFILVQIKSARRVESQKGFGYVIKADFGMVGISSLDGELNVGPSSQVLDFWFLFHVQWQVSSVVHELFL